MVLLAQALEVRASIAAAVRRKALLERWSKLWRVSKFIVVSPRKANGRDQVAIVTSKDIFASFAELIDAISVPQSGVFEVKYNSPSTMRP